MTCSYLSLDSSVSANHNNRLLQAVFPELLVCLRTFRLEQGVGCVFARIIPLGALFLLMFEYSSSVHGCICFVTFVPVSAEGPVDMKLEKILLCI